jgi:hypothetical protein
MSKPLTDHAMLVSLNISQWTARKHDKSVTTEVDQKHGAKDGGRYNKLLIDKTALDPVDKVASAARQHLYKVTLAWGDNNERILSAALFMDFTQTMKQFKNEFETRVRDLAREYPTHVQAARKRLGTMYDPKDYPADIRDRFDFSISFSPVPTANDFRVNLSAEHIEYIRADMTARLQARQTEAVKEVFQRARKIITKIHEQTSDEDRKIYDSAIENAREFVDILPALNLTGDPELTCIENEIRSLLVPADRLRADKKLRADTAKAADAILAKLPWA